MATFSPALPPQLLHNIAQNRALLTYVRQACVIVWRCCNEVLFPGNPQFAQKKLLDAAMRDSNQTACGAVAPEDIGQVMVEGNLRECMTFLYHMCRNTEFVWGLLKSLSSRTPDFIRRAVLQKHLDRVKLLTGVHADKVLFGFRDAHMQDPFLQGVPVMPIDGPANAARLSLYPLMSTKQTMNNNPLRIRVRDAIPPLSRREIAYMRLPPNCHPDTPLPWIAGYLTKGVDPTHAYCKLARQTGNSVLSGISGTTDVMLLWLELFEPFNVELATLACVGWMCPCNDHTAFEILMSALPHGIEYDAQINERAFITGLLQKYSQPRAG